MKLITYGLGGYDETKPDNNIISEVDIPEEEESTPNDNPEPV